MSGVLLNDTLVSVVVVTYNSEKFVIETLDSIKAQTYECIELIISDDCSKDNTVGIVNLWLEENSNRFVRAELVTSKHNSGVSGNINRGVNITKGNWIKTIAGDDLLAPSAIEEFVLFVKNHKKIQMCVCDIEPFSKEGYDCNSVIKSYARYFTLMSEPYDKQLCRVCREMVFPGPSYFYSRSLFDKIGGFSEEYGNFEEWPFVYKVLKSGCQIYTIEEKLVRYRVSDSSLSRSRNKGLENSSYFFSGYKFFFDYPFHDLLSQHRYVEALDMYLVYHARRYQYKTNNSMISKLLLRLVVILSPFRYLKRIGFYK